MRYVNEIIERDRNEIIAKMFFKQVDELKPQVEEMHKNEGVQKTYKNYD